MIGPGASVLLAVALLGAGGDDPHRARCEENLNAIGRALSARRKAENRLPDALSALAPKYLADKASLRCPADRSAQGDAGDGGVPDPAPGVSYSFEMGGRVSGGMAIPPGPPPESDVPGKPWGTDRNLGTWLARYYGDRVPAVRCLHHQAKSEPIALNLTLAGKVYEGSPDWRADPEPVAEFARRAARDLASDPAQFAAKWRLAGISEAARGWDRAGASEIGSEAITALAKTLLTHAEATRDAADAQRIAARLFLQVRDFAAAEAAARALLARPDHADEEDGRQALAESLAGRGMYREAGAVYQLMMMNNPESKNIRSSLADTLEASGREAEARELMETIDPGRLLVGRKAPIFHAPLLDGTDASIASCLEGKKALLVTFWFHRCGPCREEFPKLQKVHDQLKDQGLAVLAINSDDEDATITRYVRTHGWTLPILLGTKEREGRNIPDVYGVSVFPTSYLIDRDGRIVYRHVGWDEAGLRKALKGLGIE